MHVHAPINEDEMKFALSAGQIQIFKYSEAFYLFFCLDVI